MDILVILLIVLIVLLLLSSVISFIIYLWPLLLIAAIVYAIVNAFKKPHDEEEVEIHEENPDIIDVDYTVVDEEEKKEQ
ncbi:hypothetical protein SAMN05216514_10463 [Kandleria vitulina]|jgi:Ca2+/Na+ antiporter|uniref:hypothetical protein n=1 Tax=Kandleria vitulina TaxID=1630 RepID=UPI0008BE12CB|nr:hypothetical protein [Kandleria vitulina]SEI82218.1 hypothetical protein SAMN05216514_10463 [Kandleria vitulina]